VNPEAKPREHRFKTRWYPDEVVAIPENEAVRYRREYTRALADGSLKKRSEADWRSWQSADLEASKQIKVAADEAATAKVAKAAKGKA